MAEFDLIGRTLGKYRLLKEIGRGGMGVVYAGFDTALDRPVAIKVLASHLAWEKTFVDRFQREARMAAALEHPNIVTIHDVGQEAGVYYLVMRKVEGVPLSVVIVREGPMSPVRAARILAQVAEALDYAHSRNVIHRDVKPGNILVESGDRVTLTDFGIARAAEGTRLTATGINLGTPEYMSPEQALGEPIDRRTDVYSMGIVLYEMLTGRVPFHADTPLATLMQQAQTPPPSPRTVVPSVSHEVETVVLKALAKQPHDRFSSAREFSRTLQGAISQEQARQLRQQVAQAVAWLNDGRTEEALGRLESLAQTYPNNKEVAARLSEAREQARLGSLYAEVRQLWSRAQTKAGEILSAAPQYPDPDGLLKRLHKREPEPVTEQEAGWPRWLTQVGLIMVLLGGLAGAVLYRQAGEMGVNPGVCLLLVVLALMSTWKRVPLRTRQVIAIVNLALVVYTVSLTTAIVPRPYLLGSLGGIRGGLYVLEFGLLLGSGMILWTLLVSRRTELGSILMIFGGLAVVLGYGLEWIRLPQLPWDRGYELVYQKLYPDLGMPESSSGMTGLQWRGSAYPSWLRFVLVLLPTLSLLGVLVLNSASADSSRTRRKLKCLSGISLAGLAPLGLIVSGLTYFRLFQTGRPIWLFQRGYLGLWLALIGLALILLGVILRAIPILRASSVRRTPRTDDSPYVRPVSR